MACWKIGFMVFFPHFHIELADNLRVLAYNSFSQMKFQNSLKEDCFTQGEKLTHIIPSPDAVGCLKFNSFTLRTPLEPNVCYFHTFENNLRTERKFTNNLKESCSSASDKHVSFKCFPENAFVSNIFPNVSGLFWPLWVLMG